MVCAVAAVAMIAVVVVFMIAPVTVCMFAAQMFDNDGLDVDQGPD